MPEYGSPPSSPLQARRIRYWMNRDSGPSPTRGAIVTLPTSPVGSLVGRTRVKVGPLLRAKLQQKANALKWRLVQCGNQPISPDGKGRFKLPAKVASARRRAAAAEARKGKSVIEKGDPRAEAPASGDADDASIDGDDGDSEMSVIVPACPHLHLRLRRTRSLRMMTLTRRTRSLRLDRLIWEARSLLSALPKSSASALMRCTIPNQRNGRARRARKQRRCAGSLVVSSSALIR